ncbi:hypothetical protein [uncultured Arenimonas sp.]|uniref:hypothetical protein n=1 Tax=uncultured Arenimonas sp. TaxID=546226 RepID=UPI0030D94A0E
MKPSLEDRVLAFLDQLPRSTKINLGRPEVKPGEKQADYLLDEGRVVVEVKTLKQTQRWRGEAVLDEYLTYTGSKIFGSLPLSRIAMSSEHLAALEKSISSRMTRGIEKVCRSANHQIGDELGRLPHLATGTLILINENVPDLHPRLVADRVVEFTLSKRTNIHYCLLIFESHLVKVRNRSVPYPLLLDLTYSARQRRAGRFLRVIKEKWAMENGLPSGLPDPEPIELDYQPGSLTLGR